MGIHEAMVRGPGYFLGQRLTDLELVTFRKMITAQYLRHLRTIDSQLADDAKLIGIANYHLLQDRLDHATIWPKEARVLPSDDIEILKTMGFYQTIAAEYGEVSIYGEDLMWRLVRPQAADDVGPVHADRWFWEAGNGVMPAGCDRFKIWIPICAEPGRNGLSVKPYSHLREDWKRHTDMRHGKPKPVLDEKVEDLNMQLLPLSAGEMVLFHDALLHGGVVNRGTQCRVSVEMTIFFREDFQISRARHAA